MAVHSMTARTFQRLQEKLSEVVPCSAKEISPKARFDALIPREKRKEVWNALQAEGFRLPGLVLSGPVWLVTAICVVVPLLLVGLIVKAWAVLLHLPQLGLLARKITRPLAVHPPIGCETVREATLALTPFSREDYDNGLWPQEDIADKVRLIVSQSTGARFDSIRRDSRIDDLCC